MEAFWPEAAPAAARNRLNVAVHGLRRAFRTSAEVPVVVLQDGAYRLGPQLRLWLAVDEFELHVTAGRRLDAAGDRVGAAAEYERVLALYQGDFLADDPYLASAGSPTPGPGAPAPAAGAPPSPAEDRPMNANDGRIVRLFTAQVDGTVEVNTPDANAAVPGQFGLILQAEVGGVLGNSGANYTLTFAAINDDLVTRQVSLNPQGNPFKEEWNLSCGWVRSGNDFVKTGPGEADGIMRYRIAIPPGLTGAFHYNVRLVSENFQVTSFAQSNPFLLV